MTFALCFDFKLFKVKFIQTNPHHNWKFCVYVLYMVELIAVYLSVHGFITMERDKHRKMENERSCAGKTENLTCKDIVHNRQIEKRLNLNVI